MEAGKARIAHPTLALPALALISSDILLMGMTSANYAETAFFLLKKNANVHPIHRGQHPTVCVFPPPRFVLEPEFYVFFYGLFLLLCLSGVWCLRHPVDKVLTGALPAPCLLLADGRFVT